MPLNRQVFDEEQIDAGDTALSEVFDLRRVEHVEEAAVLYVEAEEDGTFSIEISLDEGTTWKVLEAGVAVTGGDLLVKGSIKMAPKYRLNYTQGATGGKVSAWFNGIQ